MNFLQSLFRITCDVSWRASCLIGLFLVLRILVRHRVPARLVFLAWVAAAIRLLIPIHISVPTNLMVLPRKFTASAFLAHRKASTPAPLNLNEIGANIGPSLPISPLGIQTFVAAKIDPLVLSRWSASIWIVGVLVLAIIRFSRTCAFRLRLQNKIAFPDARLIKLVAQISGELGTRGVEVIVSDIVDAPAVYGAFRPKIIFPLGFFERLEPEEARLLIAHELGHCHRRDLVAQMTIQIAQTLHWFNPLIWYLARVAKDDCEIACDEFVITHAVLAEPRVYGATLLKILQLTRFPRRLPITLGVVESKKQIKRRIQMIATHTSYSSRRMLIGSAILALITLLSVAHKATADEVPIANASGVTDSAPTGWWKNGEKKEAYVGGVDRKETYNGLPSAYIKSIVPSVDGFGGMMQICSADNYLGKRLRFSAFMKTKDAIDGGAHLWFRIDNKGRGNEVLEFDNMDGRAVKGTADWREYSIVLDVPQSAGQLAYGFFVSGTGQAWVNHVNIEEVGSDVPVTTISSHTGRSLPKTPVNLTFN